MRLSTKLAPLALISALLLSGCTSAPDTSDGCGKGSPANCTASPKPTATSKSTKLPAPPSRVPIKPQNETVKRDLANFKLALLAYSKEHNGTFPAKLDDSLAKYQPGVSNNTIITSYQVAKDVQPNAFCLTGTSTGGTLYVITSNTSVKGGGLCPAKHSSW